jgi:DNA (cytosine-5)-methyltransferase 1
MGAHLVTSGQPLRRQPGRSGAIRSTPTCVDLFSGAGGLAEGFHEAGWNIVAGVDSDRYAAETFQLNFPRATFLKMDVSELTPGKLLKATGLKPGELDCLLGGPPCQSFSYNNHARSASTRRARLFEHYLRIVAKLKPRLIVMENVPGMLTIGKGRIVKEIQVRLKKLGYRSQIRILYAEDFGVPQQRRRVFVIATRLPWRRPLFPIGTHGPASKPSEDAGTYIYRWKASKNRPARPLVSVWDVIGDLPLVRNGAKKFKMSYRRKTRTESQERARRGSDAVYDHVAHKLTKKMITRISKVPQGGDWRDIPRRLLPAGMKRARPNDHTKRYGRLTRKGLCCTILTKCDPHWGSYVHPLQDRTITVREAARLQTFPDTFRFCKLISKQYEQIGNAVPPAMAKRIAHTLKRHLQRRKRLPRRATHTHPPMPVAKAA